MRGIAAALVLAALAAPPLVRGDGEDRAPAERLPDFALTNWDGRTLTPASLAGATTILAFTYAKCIAACPMTTFLLKELDERLERPAAMRYLHVSVNPREDTAEEIRLHFEKHGIDPERDGRWLFANGPAAEIERLLAARGIEVRRTKTPEGTLVEHTIEVLVVGPDGTIAARFDTYLWDEKEMTDAVRKCLARSRES